MRTPLPRARRETWTAELIQPDGTRTELPLDADQPGQLTWDADGVDAVITCHHLPPELLTGQRIALTLWVDDEPQRFPQLVPVKDDPTVDEAGAWYRLHLIDETILLAADGLDFSRVLDAGTPIVAAMQSLAAVSAPGLSIAWPVTDDTLRNPLELALSSSPLAGINRLAETINATRLAPAHDGRLSVQSWTPPAERPPQLPFGPDAAAGYEHRVDLQRFHLEAPNVVHYTASGSSSAAQLVGRWRDEDPTSPWSIPSRGRRILATASGDAASQEVADALARRRGLEARGRGREATLAGAWQPLYPYEVCEVRNPDHPLLDGRWEVLSIRVTVGGDVSDATWTIKEIT